MQMAASKIRLATFASSGRLDWLTIRRTLEASKLRSALRTRDRRLIFELDGFDYLNGDGLLMLLMLGRFLVSEHKVRAILVLPGSEKQQEILRDRGFLRLARHIFQVEGRRWLEASELEGAVDTGDVFDSLYIIQKETAAHLLQGVTRALNEPVFLEKLDLEPTGESREYARDLARAVEEIVKNVIQHSGVERGLLIIEELGNFAFRLTLGDMGVGLRSTVRKNFPPKGELDPVRQAILHRYFNPSPGIFTVLSTVARWGGRFEIRSENLGFDFKSAQPRLRIDFGELAEEVRERGCEHWPFLPGVQYRIQFEFQGVTR